MKVLRKFLSNGVNGNVSCLESCAYLNIKVTEVAQRSSEVEGCNQLIISFRQKMQSTISFYIYEALSLIAEIGGYVGLFLGASVYQITDLINAGTRKLVKQF